MENIAGKIHVLAEKNAQGQLVYKTLHPETESSQITDFNSAVSGIIDARFVSPVFTGTPSAPTATKGTNTKQIATTAFVQTAISDKQNANTALSSIAGLTTKANQTIYTTGSNSYATTALTTTGRSIIGATDAAAARTAIGAISAGGTVSAAENADKLGGSSAAEYAKLVSPSFTGTPSAPTAATATNNMQIATTAFVHAVAKATNTDEKVKQNVSTSNGDYPVLLTPTVNATANVAATNAVFGAGVKVNPSTSKVTATTFVGALSGTAANADKLGGTVAANYAKLNSPNFTGTPSAPTANAGTSNTQIATTAFVNTAVHTAISNLVGSAPETLDTLQELAEALDNQPEALKDLYDAFSSKQDQSDALDSIAGLATSANQILYTTAENTYATTPVTTIGRNLLNSADAAAARTTIGAASTGEKVDSAADADKLGGIVAANYAQLASPSFTGTPSAPTAASSTNNTQIATTAFVHTVAEAAASAANTHYTTKLIAGGSTATANTAASGTVYLRLFDDSTHRNNIQVKAGTGITVASDSAGIITITNSSTNTDTKVTQNKSATNATYPILLTPTADANANVSATNAIFGSGVKVNPSTSAVTATTFIGALSGTATNANQLGGTAAASYAKLDSPSFSGTPTAPTADSTSNDTTVATTAFAKTAAEAANTHYTTKLIVGGSTATANAAVTSGNVYLRLFDDSTHRNNVQLKAGTGIKVGSDSTGVITITNSSTNTDTKVAQNKSTTNATYPILLTPTADATTNVTATNAIFGSGVKVNPSTSAVTATTFIGALSGTATNASKLGNSDAANYAKLASPTFTGTPNAPTATAGTNTTQIATTEFVHTAISNLIGTAPEALDTLQEIVEFLGTTDGAEEALLTQIGNKQDAHAALSSIAGLTTAANKMIYTTAANTYTTTDLTATGRSLVGATDAAAARTAIGAISAGGSVSTAENANKLGGTAAANYALLESPSFSGTPTAPTAASTSNDTTVATTAFVKTAAAAANTHYTTKLIVGGSAATANAAVTSGNVYLRLFDDSNHRNNVQLKAGTGITVGSDSTGIITITNSSTNTDTKVTQNKSTTNATYPILLTPTVDANANVTATNAIFGSGVKVNPSTSAITATTFIGALSGTAANASKLGNSDAVDYAKLASPTFTGTPAAPTATAGTNTTQIATTEFVQTAATNANTHYTTKLIVGGSTATDNAAVTSGNIYLRLFDDSTSRNDIQIKAGNGITVGSDSTGIITITNSKPNTDTKVSFTSDTSSTTYPLLFKNSTGTTTTAAGTRFNTGIYVTPSTSSITATTFIGTLSGTATNANQLGGTAAANYAKLDSPSFSGTPTAPTATSTSNDTTVATTAFVKTAAEAANTHYTTKLIVGGSTATANAAVTSGNIYLRLFDDSTSRNDVQIKAGTGITVGSDSTGVITITNSSTNTDTKVTQNKSTTNATYPILLTPTANATTNVTATNAIFGTGVKVNPSTSAVTATTFIGALSGTATNASKLGNSDAANYAKLASPTFTGTPAAPTATAGTNTTQIATTEFVHTAISNLIGTAPEALDTLQEIVEFLGTTDGAEEALLTQIGNKQDAHAALSSIAGLTTTANKMIYTTAANTYTTTDLTATGISLVGATDAAAARTAIGAISAGGSVSTAENANKLGGTVAADYAKLASPSFSGTPTAPTAASTSNDTTVATTAFVKTAAAAANTHYTTKLIVGGSTATANAAVTSGNVYLRLFDDSNHRNNVQLKAGTGITVGSDSTGVITITNSSTNTDTRVTQNKSTTNATYPILLTPTADATANVTATNAIFGTGVKVNPSTSAVTATTFIGALSGTATNASKLGNSDAANYAKLDSPTFTGTPNAPTAAAGTNTTQIATTEFVQTAATNANTHYTTKLIVGGSTATANATVTSGNVYLRLFDDSTHRNNVQLKAGTGITVGSDSTGVITITNSSTNTDAKVSFTADTSSTTYPLLFKNSTGTTTTAAGTRFNTGIYATPSTSSITATTFIGALSGTATNASKLGNSDAADYAKLASPSFSGTPTAPTADSTSNDTTVATTAFVKTAAAAANTHYTTKLIVGGSTATANAAVTSGNVYLRLFDDSTHRNNVQLKAGTGITVGSDSTGVITITNSSTNTDAKVSFTADTSSTTYPLLFKNSTGTTTTAAGTRFNTGIYATPSTSSITATTFIGALSGTATNANQLGGTAAANYALLASPNFSGTPSAPTATAGTNTDQIATTKFVSTAIANLVNSAPEALDTLGEIATILGDTSDLSGTLINAISNKQDAHASLSSIAELTTAANKTIYTTAANTYAVTDLTVTGRSIIGATDAAAARTAIGAISAGGSVSTATKLSASKAIDGVNFDGSAAITHYGICSTEAATVEKVVDCTGFTLVTGSRIVVKFTVTNTATDPTLNVNSTGAKAVYYRNAAINKAYLAANRTYEFVYNGTQYELVGDIDTNTNTDTKVTQNKSTTNATYPILLTPTANANANVKATTTIFGSGVKVNPSTSAITATTFIGSLSGDAALTGTPTAPTAASSTSNTQIATTAFVHSITDSLNTHYTTKLIAGGSTATANTAVTSGNVYLRLFDDTTSRNDIQLKAGTGITIGSDSTGIITITNSSTNTDTKVTQNKSATNATYPILLTPTADANANVTATNAIFGSGVKVNPSTSAITATTFIGTLSGTATNANQLGGTAAADYAKLASPSFSGTPTAPTADSTSNDTTVATTAFVKTAAAAANTHYTTKLIVGGSAATANAAVTSGNVYLRLFDDSTHRNNVQLKAGTGITVGSDSTGVITITNSSTNTDTKVTQNKSTTNATYPILLTPTADASANVTATNAIFGSGVKVNPSTSAITATTFIGALSGNAATATKFSASKAIDGVNFDGSAAIIHYGTCSTAAATVEKVVSCTGFTLVTGSRIIVKFTVTNTAANSTLNVNSTGAKAIYYRGAAITAGYLAANRTYEFVYNGTQYELVGDINTDTDTHNNLVGYVSTPSTNSAYPVLFKNSTGTTATAASTRFSANITINPSTNTITATNFNGTASKATADASGNTITTTYAKLASISSFTIPKTGWTNDTSEATDYKYYYNVSNANITANDVIEVVIARASMSAANEAQLCPVVESFAGYFQIRSASTPTTAISAEYHIFNGKTA